MPIAPADVRAAHPEIDVNTYPDPVVNFYIGRALRNVNEAQWGARATDAEIELTCHMLIQGTRTNKKANPSMIVSDHVGDVGVTFESSVQEMRNDTELSATSYGRTFMQMRRLIQPLRVI